jgi:hypothetical protein
LGEEQQGNLDSPVITLTNSYFHTQPNPVERFIIYTSKDIMHIVEPTPNDIWNFLHSMDLLTNHQHTASNTGFTLLQTAHDVTMTLYPQPLVSWGRIS